MLLSPVPRRPFTVFIPSPSPSVSLTSDFASAELGGGDPAQPGESPEPCIVTAHLAIPVINLIDTLKTQQRRREKYIATLS